MQQLCVVYLLYTCVFCVCVCASVTSFFGGGVAPPQWKINKQHVYQMATACSVERSTDCRTKLKCYSFFFPLCLKQDQAWQLYSSLRTHVTGRVWYFMVTLLSFAPSCLHAEARQRGASLK